LDTRRRDCGREVEVLRHGGGNAAAAKGVLLHLHPLVDSPCRGLADRGARVPEVLPTAELESFLTGLIIAMPLEPVAPLRGDPGLPADGFNSIEDGLVGCFAAAGVLLAGVDVVTVSGAGGSPPAPESLWVTHGAQIKGTGRPGFARAARPPRAAPVPVPRPFLFPLPPPSPGRLRRSLGLVDDVVRPQAQTCFSRASFSSAVTGMPRN
jgi:hypothetical protein